MEDVGGMELSEVIFAQEKKGLRPQLSFPASAFSRPFV